MLHVNIYICRLVPWQKQQQNNTERVQMKFIKFLCFKTNQPYSSNNYEELCQHFKLSPLYHRRRFLDAIFLYKCVNNMYDCPEILSRITFNVPQRTTRTRSVFRLTVSKINVFKYSALQRCMSTLNELCNMNHSIDISASYGTFRRLVRMICLKF